MTSKNDIRDVIDALQTDDIPIPALALSGDYSKTTDGRIPQLTFRANQESVDLNEALKVYVSYKKEED